MDPWHAAYIRASRIALPILVLWFVVVAFAGCATGPRQAHFQASEVRNATKILNRLGSEAKPYTEALCSPAPAGMAAACKVWRALYKGVLGMADGIDAAMNQADAQNTQDVDLAKVLEVGFKVLDLVTEEEAVGGGLTARKETTP